MVGRTRRLAGLLSEGDMILPRALPSDVQRVQGPHDATDVPSTRRLGASVASSTARVDPGAPAHAPRTDELSSLAYQDAKKRVLAEFNEAYLSALIRGSAGNLSEAARRSGLDRSNFRRLLRMNTLEGASVEGAPSMRGSSEDDG